MIKKEVMSLKNLGKSVNRERYMRKHEFQMEQLKDKLEMDEIKHEAMLTERRNIQNIRIKTLVESEIQR